MSGSDKSSEYDPCDCMFCSAVESSSKEDSDEDIKEAPSNDSNNAEQSNGMKDLGIKNLDGQNCPICQFRGELRNHMRQHTKRDKLFICCICGETTKTQYTLCKHFAVHAERKSFACNVCDKMLDSEAKLRLHWGTHPLQNPFSCTECDEAFSLKKDLRHHLRCVHKVKKSKLLKLDDYYSYIITYNAGTVKTRRLFHCKDCLRNFKKPAGLGAHYSYAHLKKSYPAPSQFCVVCSKEFYKISSLGKHYLDFHL